MSEWRDDSPDWRDARKRIVLLMDDGAEKHGLLILEDVAFGGDDEIPIWRVDVDGGSDLSLWDAKGWRFE